MQTVGITSLQDFSRAAFGLVKAAFGGWSELLMSYAYRQLLRSASEPLKRRAEMNIEELPLFDRDVEKKLIVAGLTGKGGDLKLGFLNFAWDRSLKFGKELLKKVESMGYSRALWAQGLALMQLMFSKGYRRYFGQMCRRRMLGFPACSSV